VRETENKIYVQRSVIELLQSTQDLALCRSLVFDITHGMSPWWR